MRELLGVIGCQFGVTTGEDFVVDEDLLFELFVSVAADDFNEWLLLGIL